MVVGEFDEGGLVEGGGVVGVGYDLAADVVGCHVCEAEGTDVEDVGGEVFWAGWGRDYYSGVGEEGGV